MNIKNLDQALVEIAEKKNQLYEYNQKELTYKELQGEVDQLLAEFQTNYGAYLEEALFNVHDEYCPDDEVLKPMAYLAAHYPQSDHTFDVEADQGIPVAADDFPGINARLVLVPRPTRLVLQGQEASFKETVWVAHESLEA